MTPNRIAYHFNLRGPSEYFDTTCSSALVTFQHGFMDSWIYGAPGSVETYQFLVTELSEIPQRMIHQDEVNESLSDEVFINDSGDKVYKKGANIDPVSACAFIRRNIKVQIAYQLNAYEIHPLPAPEKLNSRYFRNKNGYLPGALKNNFQTCSTILYLDHVNYWHERQQEMPDLYIIDLNVANHITMLFEAEAKETVQRYCQEIYTTEKVTE